MGGSVSLASTPTSISDVIELAQAVLRRQTPAEKLLPVLKEDARCYQGLGSDECERLRGVCFNALEEVGWEKDFDKLVLEELRTSYHPASLAGAARAIRGCQDPPEETLQILADAFERIIPQDRKIDPGTFHPSIDNQGANTVTVELAEAFADIATTKGVDPEVAERIRAQAKRLKPSLAEQVCQRLDAARPGSACHSCCGDGVVKLKPPEDSFDLPTEHWTNEVEDHSGRLMSLGQVLLAKPSFLTFFYTRCMNPAKCSATITRLSELSARLDELKLLESVNLAAMTYDPDYDTAKRLRVYGQDRGIEVSDTVRLVRMTDKSADFFSSMELLVGYGPSTVNRHGLDAFVFDREGRVVHSFARQIFDCSDVIGKLRALC